jgi:hypothetical protein
LRHALEHVSHYLPAQAPLEVFVHHNTLHAFQHLPFDEGVEAAREKLGGEGYLAEEVYRKAHAEGRISDADLDAALARGLPGDLPAMPQQFPEARALARLAMLHDVDPLTPSELRWRLSERESAIATSALWTACLSLTAGMKSRIQERRPAPRFPRDWLLAVGQDDPYDRVHAVLIPLCAAFLDRGQSRFSMPDRDAGFFTAWKRILTAGKAVRPAWAASLGKRLRRWEQHATEPEDVVLELLDEIGISDEELEGFVEHTLLALAGWAGMFQRLEHAPGPVGRSSALVRLMDFLAVRLTLDTLALRDAASELDFDGPLRNLRAHLRKLPQMAADSEHGPGDVAWPLFRLLHLASVPASRLLAAGPDGARAVVRLLEVLSPRFRRRVWHEAYEAHYRDQVLSALRMNRQRAAAQGPVQFQVAFCMDDREESIRRHFEEISDRHVTFGTAGFFNLAIAYQGIDDPTTFPLCPVVMEPMHRIREHVPEEHAHLAEMRRRRRERIGRLATRFYHASGSLLLGVLVTLGTGVLVALPLLASVFAPRFAGRMRKAIASRVLPEPKTSLTMPRLEDPAEENRLLDGFTVEEKVRRVAVLLENIGLTRDFAPVVAIIGHGSSSVNNPHFAAYACGACGGRSGGPNARLFARMANRPEVREGLRAYGIDVPAETVFVGGEHDTCADTIRLYDLDEAPAARMDDLLSLKRTLDRACMRNAHERIRRFESAPRRASPERAWRHVTARSYNLSEPRPELGHATNAACVVGRRRLTRGLFLDRRAFLVSYDPATDPDGSVLERTLVAVGPVGAGINLEYFFSTTDNERFGAGTKLPHNVTGLVAVMNGASSDLRTGLPKQMIEIHEPIRLQLIVEATIPTLEGIMKRQPGVAELVKNEWVRVVALDPESGAMHVYHAEDGFVPWDGVRVPVPEVASSAEWYQGKTGFIPPARLLLGERSQEVRRAG